MARSAACSSVAELAEPTETEDDIQLRDYQTEMVEAAMCENIIVAMDTGSGKTHIALARAEAELESGQRDKTIWFMAPTVALCNQQYNMFRRHLPAYQCRFLSGNDGVDSWSDQMIWDAVLLDIRIVVCTPQVLFDALSHGFVQMAGISLLVFDEAHHCTLDHPANQILKHFYHPLLRMDPGSAPRILGLSASPVMKSKVSGLETLERNMNAIAKTPKLHRTELMKYVHRPVLEKAFYKGGLTTPFSKCLTILQNKVETLQLEDDPYVRSLLARLKANPHDIVTRNSCHKVLINERTYCRDQLRLIITRSEAIEAELGEWASRWYIKNVLSMRLGFIQEAAPRFIQFSNEEKTYLHGVLSEIEDSIRDELAVGDFETSEKAAQLIELLCSEYRAQFTGIVFVEQRATAVALSNLLAAHPKTRESFRPAPYVGLSASNKMADLIDPRGLDLTLDEFTAGKKNLIVSTSVLEEGIDIPNCHLVVCFEQPKNLKSFIQRRGRARKQDSKYIIMVPDTNPIKGPEKWDELEQVMKTMYLDDLRQAKAAKALERIEEDVGRIKYRVESSGALLTLNNANAHLYHFCNKLLSGSDIGLRPQFAFTKEPLSKLKSATVTLPSSVNPAVRTASSSLAWKTERNAAKDAAFQAYVALHKAGLVNDNLLPLTQDIEDALRSDTIQDGPSLVLTQSTLDPWHSIASAHRSDSIIWSKTMISLSMGEFGSTAVMMFLPLAVNCIEEIPLFWNETTSFTASTKYVGDCHLSQEEVSVIRKSTLILLSTVFGTRVDETRTEYLVYFAPEFRALHELHHWNQTMIGRIPAKDAMLPSLMPGQTNLLKIGRESIQLTKPFIVHNFSTTIIEADDDETHEELILHISNFPKKRDFFRPWTMATEEIRNSAYTSLRTIPAEACQIDNISLQHSLFVLFVPSILRRLETWWIADELVSTILAPLSGMSKRLVLTAITASSAYELDDYQRLEFLGDCVLKYCTSMQLMAQHPLWPEKYLTEVKSRIVSNGSLARAALRTGLDAFIIAETFRTAKWKPKTVDDVLGETGRSAEQVPRSRKLLADVVESLIGASFVDGGLDKALQCINIFLPDQMPSRTLKEAHTTLYNNANQKDDVQLPDLEALVGHKFRNPALLVEAVTHGSFKGYGSDAVVSYQRLEFLGDAVLDLLVTRSLFAHQPPLSHHKMHTLRSANVSEYLLSFVVMEHCMLETRYEIVTEQSGNGKKFLPHEKQAKRAIWQFMRHSSVDVADHQQRVVARHEALREQVNSALWTADEFPWHSMVQIGADKFFSDLVESVLGAIYVDSLGDLSACSDFVESLNIMDIMKRLLADNVDCTHPKEMLGQLAVTDTVKYYIREEDSNPNASPEQQRPRRFFGVKVGESFASEIPDGDWTAGLRRLDIETCVASEAIKRLRADRMDKLN
ncbi:hypothetical protein BDY21DRAFT_319388 [Lineolata rhizophorae]|uniref:Dicer-like protein 2 n=1 Tax=Lineolata rhizophorae TaxID=578093 RepID=A0A6A6P333_9PEZI|nr:hypothetical protein BDY21DRAFT_319388 [Lineolata rhizophorae]